MGILYDIRAKLRLIFDYLIDFLFATYYKSAKNRLPPITNKLLLESATSLSRKIKKRQVKSEEVVDAFIERIKEVNPFINALVDERFIDALKEARKIDEDIRNGRLTQDDYNAKPLLGVPFTTKESNASKGLKWTLGLLVRKNVVAEEDSDIVRLMKEAGAIQIGVTNVPQLNFWAESYNPVYGICCNPYDLTRNPGGSSGGEGSLIAACGSPMGIGTDLGGSIRMPAHRCGIFGHKPSQHLSPTKGMSFSKGDVPMLGVIGPLSKHAEDLIPMLKVFAGSNVNKLTLDEPVDLKQLNIFYMTSIQCRRNVPIEKQMQLAVLKVIDHFEELSGKKAVEVDFDDTKYALELWSYKIKLENIDFNYNITNRQGRVNVPIEYLKYLFGMSEYNAYTLYNMVEGILTPVDFKWAKSTLEKLKDSIVTKLGDNGVLIFPSEPRPADYHHTTLFRTGLNYVCLWNALELPVTQVPLGLNREGLPIGVQVVASPYKDHLTLAVAAELEKTFGGYVRPS